MIDSMADMNRSVEERFLRRDLKGQELGSQCLFAEKWSAVPSEDGEKYELRLPIRLPGLEPSFSSGRGRR